MSVTQKNIQLLDTKEQLEHRVRDLKLLFDLEHAMGRAESLEELFIAVLGEAMRACEAKMGAVALRDAETGTGAIYVIDERAKKLKRVAYPADVGLIGWAIKHNQMLVSSDAESDARRDRELDTRVGGATAKTAIAVPLEGEHKAAMGAIAIYNKRRGSPFSDEDRGLLELITANASTAIRLQLSREAREREERLTTIGRLLSGVIHDLKTPLTVIGGYVQMMQSSKVATERAKFAKLILKQFDHIGAMQREVLEFARGEKSVLIRKVYLQKFFDDVREQLEADLARRGIELVVDVQERGTARFDEAKILRVVNNLARNAVEAMGRGALVMYLNTPENAEVAGDAGIPFEAGELGAKLEVVVKMAEAERAEWGRRAMERVAERYSWDSVTKEYERLLLKIAVGRHEA